VQEIKQLRVRAALCLIADVLTAMQLTHDSFT